MFKNLLKFEKNKFYLHVYKQNFLFTNYSTNFNYTKIPDEKKFLDDLFIQQNKLCLASFNQNSNKILVFNKTNFNFNNDFNSEKPTQEQLELIYKYLEKNFVNFLTDRINPYYFDENLIFVNNLFYNSFRSVGLKSFLSKITFLKVYLNSRYFFFDLKVLNITKIPEENLIKIRWRIETIGQNLYLFFFWLSKFTKNKELVWNDGIAYFYVNNEGKICKIVIERIEKDVNKQTVNIPLKMAKF